MEINREERLKFLNEIKDFEEEITQKVNEILKELNWDRETLMKNYAKKQECEKKLKKNDPEEHVQYSEDYQEFYRGRIPSLIIDKDLQVKIIEDAKKANPGMSLMFPVEDLGARNLPKSPDDVLFNYTREEKLALYEYAAGNMKIKPEDEKSYMLKMPEESSSKSMTFADVVDMERQLKRRRMKHRTTKEPPLSYNETIRKLINTQTEAWESYLKQSQEAISEPKQKHHHKRKHEKKEKKHKRKRSRS
ncbi:uncharacterized protein LOC129786712 [Lutzomyia longipalpis]|uniref:uncharacterized protein LOC129786712 n=1 Tax=Lutzomyia longipalpis TaxID=7200 RepID=UPI0024841E17|nr:uncharacterized protein LOC129786712 [Lutzomyia longipalpis]